MKNYLILLLLCLSASASAQYYGSNRPGVDRRLITRDSNIPRDDKQPDKAEIVEKSLQILTEKLTLDAFQQAVVRQTLEEAQKEEEKIVAEDIPNESKYEKLGVLREKINNKIKGILSPAQIEIFEKVGKEKKDKKKK